MYETSCFRQIIVTVLKLLRFFLMAWLRGQDLNLRRISKIIDNIDLQWPEWGTTSGGQSSADVESSRDVLVWL
jgi:hypothetical protein